jgi:hypothetical protein
MTKGGPPEFRTELASLYLESGWKEPPLSQAVPVFREEDAQGDGPNLFALTEELVLRRAREIYAQGHG